jgi:hypothetical protein
VLLGNQWAVILRFLQSGSYRVVMEVSFWGIQKEMFSPTSRSVSSPLAPRYSSTSVTLCTKSVRRHMATVHLPVTIQKIIGRSSRTWVLRVFMGIGAEREERGYLNKVTHGGLRDS